MAAKKKISNKQAGKKVIDSVFARLMVHVNEARSAIKDAEYDIGANQLAFLRMKGQLVMPAYLIAAVAALHHFTLRKAQVTEKRKKDDEEIPRIIGGKSRKELLGALWCIELLLEAAAAERHGKKKGGRRGAAR